MTDPTPTVVLASVWFAVVCVPAGLLLRLDPARWPLWRGVWTAGAASFVVHTLSAYGLVYGWSQAVAVAETRRQTVAATGFDSGAGLYLNLLFAALWTADAAWAWIRPGRVRGRTTWPALASHAFLAFMLLNGAFVFVGGTRRWFGLGVSIVVVMLLGLALQRHRRQGRQLA